MKMDQIDSKKSNLDCLLSPQMFKAIGDPNRIAILRHLSERCTPLTVGQIAENLPVDISVVSRHLAILRDVEILIARKEGKEVRYSVNSRNLIATLRAIADAFEACCPEECVVTRETDGGPKRSRTGKNKGRSR